MPHHVPHDNARAATATTWDACWPTLLCCPNTDGAHTYALCRHCEPGAAGGCGGLRALIAGAQSGINNRSAHNTQHAADMPRTGPGVRHNARPTSCEHACQWQHGPTQYPLAMPRCAEWPHPHTQPLGNTCAHAASDAIGHAAHVRSKLCLVAKTRMTSCAVSGCAVPRRPSMLGPAAPTCDHE